MDEARALALGGAPCGASVLALGQDAGRARAGGEWASPSGGLYLSVVIRSMLPPSHAGALSVEAASATALALAKAGLPSVSYRWPNGIVMSSGGGGSQHRIGGVLVEPHGDLGAADFYIVGLGLAPSVFSHPGVRRAELAANIVRTLVDWARNPVLDPSRWLHLVPAGSATLNIRLWNGERRRLHPSGFNACGDLVPSDGGPAISMGECLDVVIEGEHF